MAEKSSWSELPFDLQEEFYRLSETTAEDLARHITQVESEISNYWPQVEFAIRPLANAKKDLTIAAVDGSRSPEPTRRLGADFAVYSAGLLKLKGKNVTENRFVVGKVDSVGPQTTDLADLLSAKSLQAEREAAVASMRDSDLVLLDGSFYAFARDVMNVLRGNPQATQRLVEWSDAISATLRSTDDLLNSGRCIGVVKRSRTRAISGWLSLKNGTTIFPGLIDKHIVNRKLPPRSLFDYDTLMSGESILAYSVLAYNLASTRETGPGKEAFERAKELTARRFLKAFEEPFGLRVDPSRLRRVQVRLFGDAPPCELEIPNSVPPELVENLLTTENFSEATGLPHAIDMIDEHVGIPRAFTRDFVYEVEARVASLTPSTLSGVRGFFSGLNPQKERIE